mmetsp:Transcript_6357/g.25425  ORF Transcript_6357/g.25425 Transcript_6357/m.25425 type:complete len:267 (+) Transcript_6357:2319-3119(+)
MLERRDSVDSQRERLFGDERVHRWVRKGAPAKAKVLHANFVRPILETAQQLFVSVVHVPFEFAPFGSRVTTQKILLLVSLVRVFGFRRDPFAAAHRAVLNSNEFQVHVHRRKNLIVGASRPKHGAIRINHGEPERSAIGRGIGYARRQVVGQGGPVELHLRTTLTPRHFAERNRVPDGVAIEITVLPQVEFAQTFHAQHDILDVLRQVAQRIDGERERRRLYFFLHSQQIAVDKFERCDIAERRHSNLVYCELDVSHLRSHRRREL